jgi:hypothetical protein
MRNDIILDLFFAEHKDKILAYLDMVEVYRLGQSDPSRTEMDELIDENPLRALHQIRAGLIGNPANPVSEGVGRRLRGPSIRAHKAEEEAIKDVVDFARRKRAQTRMPQSLYQNMLLAPSLQSAKGMFDRAVESGLAVSYYKAVEEPKQHRRRDVEALKDKVKRWRHNYDATDVSVWEVLKQCSTLLTAQNLFATLKEEGKLVSKGKVKRAMLNPDLLSKSEPGIEAAEHTPIQQFLIEQQRQYKAKKPYAWKSVEAQSDVEQARHVFNLAMNNGDFVPRNA